MKKSTIKVFGIICLFIGIPVFAAQPAETQKPGLAVYGFSGDGVSKETGQALGTELMTGKSSEILKQSFRVVDRTNVVNRTIDRVEDLLEVKALIDYGEKAGTQYVLAGYITQFQKSKLVIIMLLKMRTPDTPQLAAGYYTIYGDTSDIPKFLPDAAGLFIEKIKSPGNTEKNLRIVPFDIAPSITGAAEKDASTLALLLTIEIANTQKYVVIPYLEATKEDVKTEEDKGRLGETGKDKDTKTYILVASIINLGEKKQSKKFTGAITRLDNEHEKGANIDYTQLSDGIVLMPKLSKELTGQTAKGKHLAQVRKAIRDKNTQAFFSDTRKFWSIGISGGTSFTVPWVITTVNATLSPFPYAFFDIGADVGLVHGYDRPDLSYISVYPFAHFNGFVPFGGYGGWYAGAGAGYMMAFYGENGEDTFLQTPAFDLTTGFYFGAAHHYGTLSYTFRTPIDPPLEQFFKVGNHKLSIGYSYRF